MLQCFIMDTVIIPITDFIRKFGQYADILANVDKLILTREGRPFATVEITAEEKNKKLLSLKNSWNGKLFENEEVWKAVLTRRNRRKPIKI